VTDFLTIHRGDAPLIVAFPHTGTDIPPEIEARLVSPWIGRKDADWWVDRLYDFARDLGSTTIRTNVSRTVIDVNRDPSGASLYPGQTTTGLCPVDSFDGEPLYRDGEAPDDAEIDERRDRWFDPYHAAITDEIARLRALHPRVVLYDAHSIRGAIPRLFEGDLADLNIGTNDDKSCDLALTEAVAAACARSRFSHVVDGRFKGGWTTRHYGNPTSGVHAIQMELACRAYLDEPETPDASNWPTPYAEPRAAPLRTVLRDVLQSTLAFA